MCKGHVHAELMKQYAEDAAVMERPWENWQANSGNGWTSTADHPKWWTTASYRRKPNTVMVNGFEVVAPVKLALKDCEAYYCATPDTECWYGTARWRNDSDDKRWFTRGLIFLKREHAIAYAKAMCGINPNS